MERRPRIRGSPADGARRRRSGPIMSAACSARSRLREAREPRRAGALMASALHAIEDEAIREAIRMQE